MAEVKLEPLPFKDAIAALRTRGVELRPTFHYLDMWQQEHASAFTVAKAMDLDMLGDIHREVTQAIAEGETLETFQRRLKPQLIRRGWWGRREMVDPATGELTEVQLGSPHRLRTIFDANMRTSHATGRWARFQRTKATRPYLRYVAVLDTRTRPQHRTWHAIILPVDHPWWETHAPPNGWYCRCQLTSLSERDLRRYGVSVTLEPPTIEMRRWRNPRTGEDEWVPQGIDPGWAYNPGAAGVRAGGRVAQTAEAGAAKLVSSPPALAAQTWRATPQLRQALAGDWTDLAGEALADDPRRSAAVRASRRVVGMVPHPVQVRLAALDPSQPPGGVLTASGGEIYHAMRQAKRDAGAAVPDAVMTTLPEHLAAPRAIVAERRPDGRLSALHYVIDGPGDDPRVVKIVMHGPRGLPGSRWADGVQRVRRAWRMASAGRVPAADMLKALHTVVWGSL